ncbi:MAG: DUF5107 domain-containing protein [Nibricoccus sp.]
MSSVRASRESVTLPTYAPAAPDRNPMFLEKRVYQGSSGRVYPLPFTDRIEEKPKPRAWDAVILENEFIYVMILPELGGRIHVGRDKTNNYDFFYRQDVIKPALVGLAGPWISGGVEFNWPQHHRPSTFMLADVQIEKHPDGSVTVWLSEHDPMARMKGMHGVCVRPDSAAIELKARAYNRTPHPQTFLWWANVATRVHEQYQSFFPTDVTFVADHAKRAMSRFPLCEETYYGVNYGMRGKHGIPAMEVPNQFIPPHAAANSTNGSQPVANSQKHPSYNPADLSWYANIPVPTSYMAMGSQDDFFGGYDHAAQAGVVHIANHHISPGKKQWTWGNDEFGYAWDRNLTDPDAAGICHPYIEIMAGVYTDNQPDFSFLQPGETKSWSQYWYPIQLIGPAQQANVDAALSFEIKGRNARLGVCPSRPFPHATIALRRRDRVLASFTHDLKPNSPFVTEVPLPKSIAATELTLVAQDATGREIITYTPRKITPAAKEEIAKIAATEPPLPANIIGADELYITGLHLAQYRHATRCPTLYWLEALRRDPGDSRCHTAMGKWHLQRGEFAHAEIHFCSAIARLISRNPNPADGEALYQLGLTLRYLALSEKNPTAQSALEKLHDAYSAFYKATWNQAWASAAYHALAEIDATRSDWAKALDHLNRSLRFNTDNLRARNLRVVALRHLGRSDEANAALRETLALDPLDWWARHLSNEPLTCDNQVRLDLAHDHIRAGLFTEALSLITSEKSPPALPKNDQTVCHLLNDKLSGTGRTPLCSHGRLSDADSKNPANLGTAPLLAYTAAWVCHLMNDKLSARRWLKVARQAAPDYCFPARIEEQIVFEHAMAADARDARAPFYLGHFLYDRRRHHEALVCWEKAVRFEPKNAVAWRCLGIGYFNILQKPAKARLAYEKAFRANPSDARLLFERDQLWKRLGDAPTRRLKELERHRDLVQQRDDLSVELCAIYNQTGQPARALEIVSTRKFQPWEGGEGQALGQHVRTHLALGRKALSTGRHADAIKHFTAAGAAPHNLGEARHLLANQSDIYFWLGEALSAADRTDEARQQWKAAASFRGDFQAMSVRTFSEMTYYSALSLLRLRQAAKAKKLLRDLQRYAKKLALTPAKIDYFATSLPTMLLFDDDLQERQTTTALFLEAQALHGLGQTKAAQKLLRTVLSRDPNHPQAADLFAQS